MLERTDPGHMINKLNIYGLNPLYLAAMNGNLNVKQILNNRVNKSLLRWSLFSLRMKQILLLLQRLFEKLFEETHHKFRLEEPSRNLLWKSHLGLKKYMRCLV